MLALLCATAQPLTGVGQVMVSDHPGSHACLGILELPEQGMCYRKGLRVMPYGILISPAFKCAIARANGLAPGNQPVGQARIRGPALRCNCLHNVLRVLCSA
jgi:hypothetical protein